MNDCHFVVDRKPESVLKQRWVFKEIQNNFSYFSNENIYSDRSSEPSCQDVQMKGITIFIYDYREWSLTMHGPHSVFHIGHCTVIHCDAGEQRKSDIPLTDQ